MKGGKGGLSFSIFLVSREWFRRERESDRPTVFHFPPRHSSFDSFSSPPIQPFSSHSISSPPPFLCPSAVSAHKGRKKEGMGKERMGGSVAKAAAAAAALLFSSSESPFFSVRLSAFLAFLLARSNRSGGRRLVLPRSSPEWKLVI